MSLFAFRNKRGEISSRMLDSEAKKRKYFRQQWISKKQALMQRETNSFGNVLFIFFASMAKRENFCVLEHERETFTKIDEAKLLVCRARNGDHEISDLFLAVCWCSAWKILFLKLVAKRNYREQKSINFHKHLLVLSLRSLRIQLEFNFYYIEQFSTLYPCFLCKSLSTTLVKRNEKNSIIIVFLALLPSKTHRNCTMQFTKMLHDFAGERSNGRLACIADYNHDYKYFFGSHVTKWVSNNKVMFTKPKTKHAFLDLPQFPLQNLEIPFRSNLITDNLRP